MDVLPADAAAVASDRPIPRDTMADLVEAAELLDIDGSCRRDVLARSDARFGRFQIAHPVQSQPPQMRVRRRRHATSTAIATCVALPAQSLNGCARGRRCWLGNERGLEERSRNQSTSVCAEPTRPIWRLSSVVVLTGARPRPCSAAFDHKPYPHGLSTFGCQGAFLWSVHSVSPRNRWCLANSDFPSGPNGQLLKVHT